LHTHEIVDSVIRNITLQDYANIGKRLKKLGPKAHIFVEMSRFQDWLVSVSTNITVNKYLKVKICCFVSLLLFYLLIDNSDRAKLSIRLHSTL